MIWLLGKAINYWVVVQELEKGLGGMLEQYGGIQQEEQLQTAGQTNSRTSKRNRQPLKGEQLNDASDTPAVVFGSVKVDGSSCTQGTAGWTHDSVSGSVTSTCSGRVPYCKAASEQLLSGM